MDDNELRDNVGVLHTDHVEETLAELQQLVREHEVALQRVSKFVASSIDDPITHSCRSRRGCHRQVANATGMGLKHHLVL